MLMKKIIFIKLFLLIFFNLAALDKQPISSNGAVGYGHCKIKSIKEILSLYSNDELIKIKIFSIVQSQVGRIEGLEEMPNLEKLDLSECGIIKIENLNQLTNLKELTIRSNGITKLEGLNFPKSLVVLDLSSNRIDKLEGMNNLENLEELSLTYCGIKKLENLDKLIKLKDLKMGANGITKIEGLENLKYLKVLALGYNKIEKIENLNNLESLEVLGLGYNKIQVIENINKLKMLKLFSIIENPLKSIDEDSYNFIINKKDLAYDPDYILGYTKIPVKNVPVKYIAQVDTLRIRESPNQGGKIIRMLSKGENLELLEKGKEETISGVHGSWLKVKTDKGEIGWCFDAYLEEVKDNTGDKK
jgi:Leucine-rich repeat (LRR) protein